MIEPSQLDRLLLVPPESGNHSNEQSFERTIVRWRGASTSDREIVSAADAYRADLAAQSIGPGDRVVVFADTHPDLIVALVGHLRAGVVHVPVNTRYAARELEHVLTDAQPSLVLTDALHADLVRSVAPEMPLCQIGGESPLVSRRLAPTSGLPLRRPRRDDPALMIYTSGTTGPSKGVVLSIGAVVGNMAALTRLWGWTGEDRLVLALPLFHVHGLCIGLIGALLNEVEIELLPSFGPVGVVDGIASGGTIFMAVPTMYVRIVDHLQTHPEAAATLRTARLFTSGSAPLSPDVFERFAALTGHQIVERYGMSETLITLANRIEGPRRPGVVGRPVPGIEVRVVDEAGRELSLPAQGELEVRGTGVMTEYWGRPEATREQFHDGWFRTGDVVSVDDSGDFRILGRKSVDFIKTGGFKVSAREIEDVLREHPDVRDAAVVGREDAEWGQAIIAVIVPVSPPRDRHALEQELVDWTAERLAGFKKPREVIFVDALPQNALGKVQKHRLLIR